jgi:hypothetical protein
MANLPALDKPSRCRASMNRQVLGATKKSSFGFILKLVAFLLRLSIGSLARYKTLLPHKDQLLSLESNEWALIPWQLADLRSPGKSGDPRNPNNIGGERRFPSRE